MVLYFDYLYLMIKMLVVIFCIIINEITQGEIFLSLFTLKYFNYNNKKRRAVKYESDSRYSFA